MILFFKATHPLALLHLPLELPPPPPRERGRQLGSHQGGHGIGNRTAGLAVVVVAAFFDTNDNKCFLKPYALSIAAIKCCCDIFEIKYEARKKVQGDLSFGEILIF